MTTSQLTYQRHSDRVCFCCARPAIGFGYAPSDRAKVGWVCDDEDCLQIARSSYAMSAKEFTRIDTLAAKEGGAAGGEYLDGLGKFDLSVLSEEEYDEYCRRVVGGYRVALQTTLRDESPF